MTAFRDRTCRGFLTEIPEAAVPGVAATYSLVLVTGVSAGVDGRAARNLS